MALFTPAGCLRESSAARRATAGSPRARWRARRTGGKGPGSNTGTGRRGLSDSRKIASGCAEIIPDTRAKKKLKAVPLSSAISRGDRGCPRSREATVKQWRSLNLSPRFAMRGGVIGPPGLEGTTTPSPHRLQAPIPALGRPTSPRDIYLIYCGSSAVEALFFVAMDNVACDRRRCISVPEEFGTASWHGQEDRGGCADYPPGPRPQECVWSTAFPACCSTLTGTLTKNVEPAPSWTSTQNSTAMHGDDTPGDRQAEPRPPFVLVEELSACWNSSKILT